MKSLEIYLNGEAGGYHTLMVVEGHRREQHSFTSQKTDEMYGEAARLIESDKTFEKSARVIDPARKTVKNGDTRLAYSSLRHFAPHSGKAPAAN
jgi:hypothetical protein